MIRLCTVLSIVVYNVLNGVGGRTKWGTSKQRGGASPPPSETSPAPRGGYRPPQRSKKKEQSKKKTGGAEGPSAPLHSLPGVAPLGEAKLGDASRTGYRPPQGCTPYREWLCSSPSFASPNEVTPERECNEVGGDSPPKVPPQPPQFQIKDIDSCYETVVLPHPSKESIPPEIKSYLSLNAMI
jgi:hypothetical protein